MFYNKKPWKVEEAVCLLNKKANILCYSMIKIKSPFAAEIL